MNDATSLYDSLDRWLDQLDEHYENDAEERQPFPLEDPRFVAALSHLVDATTPDMWVLGDQYGGHVLAVIAKALGDRLGGRPPLKAKGLTTLHRHLHRLGERDGWQCSYCGRDVGCPCSPLTEPAVSDHVFPRSRGGADDDSNRALACRRCNQEKLDQTPDEWGGP